MKHLRYLRYVALHKLYVFIAGVAIARVMGQGLSLAWVWRLLVHDLSKLRQSEWRPYATFFYSDDADTWIARNEREFKRYHGPETDRARKIAEARWGEEKKQRQAKFNHAWLLHLHRNDHHWQWWMLREDSGKTIATLPPAAVVDEMLADWMGAGLKIMAWPTLAECVAETVKWYMANREIIVLREVARERIETTLHGLSAHYGLLDMAYQVRQAKLARKSITVAR